MRVLVVIEYEQRENETEEETKEIVKGNIEFCLGKVLKIDLVDR